MSHRSRAGHSLIEVLLGAAILTIVNLAMMSGLTAAQTLNSISSDTLVATSRAEEAMEAILALPFEEMSYQDGAGFSIEDMDFEDPEVGSFAITPVPGTNNQLYTVRASIVAPSQGGRPAINVELVSMRSSQ